MDYSPLPFKTQIRVSSTSGHLSRPEKFGPPEIETSEIVYNEKEDFLGEGVFGKVFKGRCRQTPVAVKVPKKQFLSTREREDFKREVNIMSQIFHPNVVLFMGACTESGNIRIVTERMTTDLEKLLHSPMGKNIPVFVRIKMAKDAAKGMSWLHGINSIIHRDLKPANLLVDSNYNVKVTDFGFSEILREGKTSRDMFGPRGTALWMSPEVMNNQEFDKTVDVYSFGMILWEIFYLEEPLTNFDDWDEFYEAICKNGLRPNIKSDCPASLKHLMQSCWDADRRKRPSFPLIVYRLDEVLVDVALQSKQAAAFWKKYFLVPKQELEENVRWRDFLHALSDATKIQDLTRFEILRPYLTVISPEEHVTLISFDNAVGWFGYFFLQETAEKTLLEVKELVSKKWFHGDIEKGESDGRLARQSEGAYLVRLSTTLREFPFTLSLTRQRHYRIKKITQHDGKIYLSIANQPQLYKNLIELVEGMVEPLGLTQPCPNTPVTDAYSQDGIDKFQ